MKLLREREMWIAGVFRQSLADHMNHLDPTQDRFPVGPAAVDHDPLRPAMPLQRLRGGAGHQQSASLIAAVENWGGRAVPESIGYRVARTFRSDLISAVYAAYTAPMLTREPRAPTASALAPSSQSKRMNRCGAC